MIQYAPDYAVIEREVPALELADAVVALAVLHIEETEIRKDSHEDGAVLARDLTIERVSGKPVWSISSGCLPEESRERISF